MDRMISRRYTYAMIIPGFIIYSVLFLIPNILGLGISFTNITGFNLDTITFARLQNYIDIFTDSDLRIALVNSFIFTIITTIFKTSLGMLLAIILNQQINSRNVLRGIYFLPAIMNSIVVGLIFTSIMHPTTGLINKLLYSCGLGVLTQDWLANSKIAIFSVSFIEIWKWTGFCMVILLAGLQTVSKEYYEAADIDGVTEFQKFRYMTFPLILPAFNNCFVLNIIGGLKVFDLVQATTQGGPGAATQVFGTLVYRAFGFGRLGEGSAASILLAIIVMLIALPTYNSIAGKEVEA